ncbi:ABC transporter permease subunit, partial [Francisella tularensis subsp. holarctica]
KFGTIVLIVNTIFGLTLGTIAGLKKDGILDRIVSIFSVNFIAIPKVITAPVLVLIFAVELHWLQPGQWGMDFRHLVLPVIAMSLP